MKKLNYDYIKIFVEENNCKLISKEYISAISKMKFVCKCGNEFETSFTKFNSHNKRQCNDCGKELRLLQRRKCIDEIKLEIKKRNAILLSKEYKSNSIPLNILCECGKTFKRCYSNIQQSKGDILCLSCSNSKNNLLDYEHIKSEVYKTGCKLISKEYIDCRKSLTFKCSCGNLFKANWNNFNSGNQRKCYKCSKNIVNKLSYEYIKTLVDNTDCELISEQYVNSRELLMFRCVCGSQFKKSWSNFHNHNQQRCYKCSKKQSKAEIKIEKILTKLKVEYKVEHKFKGCKYKRLLPFDFYLPKYNIAIEFDGEFHFKDTPLADLELQQKRDIIKNEFCKDNNIKLFRIHYKNFNNLENIINNIVNTEVTL